MAKDQHPLLAEDRPSSEQSSDRHVEEEDNLLTGQHNTHSHTYGWSFWREVGIFVWALIATALVVVLAVLHQHQQTSQSHRSGGWGKDGKPTGKRNLIFMVSDGMGPTSLSLTRSFRQAESGLPIDDVLVLDQHMVGTSRTRSTSSLITDSAAGATAFSCGLKSYNGAISVLPDHSPCGTVLEAAKKAGYMTGLVVTTRITDATPACFAAHVNKRDEEDRIAEQEVGEHPLGRVLDVMLGGGRCHFLPNTTDGSCRGDDKDIVAMAQKNGFSYVSDRAGFDSLDFSHSTTLPLLGLFAKTDIPYEIDRRNQADIYPSLDEMARTALTALTAATADSPQGFFLMIEGSRIDHAGHGNDPVAQVHEVLAYDKAFSSVLSFLDSTPTEGILVGTSDHETGGLATARQLHDQYPIYHWFPHLLHNATRSAENLAYQLRDHLHSQPPPAKTDTETFIRTTLLGDGLGVHDPTPDEVTRLLDTSDPWPASYLLADLISRRAQVGWSTHGHSAVDVNVYASHPRHAKKLIGNHENTEIGAFLSEYLAVDVEAITRELNAFDKGPESGEWMGRPIDDIHAIDHYEGDFKKRSPECDCGIVH